MQQYFLEAIVTAEYIQRFLYGIKRPCRFFIEPCVKLVDINEELFYRCFSLSLLPDQIVDVFAAASSQTDEIVVGIQIKYLFLPLLQDVNSLLR